MADSNTSVVVTRTIDASAKDIFDLLTLPDNHVKLDGSGFVRSVDTADRITATGQKFRMNMHGPHMGGEYQTDNTVTGYVPDKLVAWQTGPPDAAPPGWEWLWELTPQGPNSTDVSLTYDWSKVNDKALLKRISFPLVEKSALEDSLSRLAETLSGS